MKCGDSATQLEGSIDYGTDHPTSQLKEKHCCATHVWYVTNVVHGIISKRRLSTCCSIREWWHVPHWSCIDVVHTISVSFVQRESMLYPRWANGRYALDDNTIRNKKVPPLLSLTIFFSWMSHWTRGKCKISPIAVKCTKSVQCFCDHALKHRTWVANRLNAKVS